MTDTVTPLATVAQLMAGPFADLFVHFDPDVVQQFLVDATRMCEDETDRRLAPFTGLVETHRASGVDPDEYGDAGGIPIDPQCVVGASYAGVEMRDAEAEAKSAVRKAQTPVVVNGVRHVGMGVEGERFRAASVDVGAMRVVAVVPVTQRGIYIELSDI